MYICGGNGSGGADAVGVVLTTVHSMQRQKRTCKRGMSLFAAACDNVRLRINTKKAGIMYQPPPNTTYNANSINSNGAQVKSVDTFIYLGSNHSRSVRNRQSLPSLRTHAEPPLESPRSSPQHQTQDAKSCHLADPVVGAET
ncbi:unnamed protein product [Schistocephalus solidus]|uniref:Uncharacterized protein n=1 Tax=Schistocephalus solidus TaxID=70667 RepID=A0A183TF56_SCHSO|nr:unnamed protein product [Schistocephalus solidus]